MKFDRNVFVWGLPNPVQSIQAQATNVVGDASGIAGKATSEVARATKVGEDIKNIATSGIAAGQTHNNGLSQKSCSVGTKFGCVEFDGRSDCVRFPMKKYDVF